MLQGTPMPTTVEDGLRASYTCFGLEQARESGTVVDMSSYWKNLG
jgi:hypothetical protein